MCRFIQSKDLVNLKLLVVSKQLCYIFCNVRVPKYWAQLLYKSSVQSFNKFVLRNIGEAMAVNSVCSEVKQVVHFPLEDQMGLRPGRPVDNGPQEGDYSAWVAWRKGKVWLPCLSFLYPLSLSLRLPRQSSPSPVAHYLQGALA